MDELLTPVATTYLRPRKEDEFLVKTADSTEESVPVRIIDTVSSADEALDVLKNQPSYESLIAVLKYLAAHHTDSAAVSIHSPTSKSASIIQTLVTEIAPNYWTLLAEGSGDINDDASTLSRDKELFVQCLQNVTGINSILSHVRSLVQESKIRSKDSNRLDIPLNLGILLQLLGAVLQDDSSIQQLWKNTNPEAASEVQRKGQSQILLSLLASGKLVSLAAEASSIASKQQEQNVPAWIADGLEYSRWVGKNITYWIRHDPQENELQFCSSLFQRAQSLGYSSPLIKELVGSLLLSTAAHVEGFIGVCLRQPLMAKKVLHVLLDHLSTKFLNSLDLEDPSPNTFVSAAAGIINSVIQGDETRMNHLVSWCTSSSGAGLGNGVGIRRAVSAVIAQSKESITSLMEKTMTQFGDELYIRHTPVLQQNIHTEILLICAGYVSRLSPIKLTMMIRSGPYLSAISNRIAATQARPRFLGMVVGESLSSLVDTKGKTLDFHMEETNIEEVENLKSLTKVNDPIGPSDVLLSISHSAPRPGKTEAPLKRKAKKPIPKPTPSAPSNGKHKAIIEEVGSSSDEDDDLVPYAKHSDPEDSDEDATLVQRNKPRPPVYIRDLIAFLRDPESYDKQKLALQTAPTLVRRKANYGTEVSFHADELAGLLVGAQDKFELDDFENLRLQGMIALVVSQPKTMAPWFARTFFEGDYSLSQRMSVLVTLGLSARQLAGFETSEYQSAAVFPSKRLPERMEELYLGTSTQPERLPASDIKALPSAALDTITKSLTSSFLGPLAAEAADATTGPDVLKLESFTARYKSKSSQRPRVRNIPNTAAAILANSFFSPLTAHFQAAIHSSKPAVLNPGLLAVYLQTLGVIVHAAGPSTLSLPQLTSELWDLLLGVRPHVLGEMGALRGWLVAMAALLEVNEGDIRRLCVDQAREVVETREWVGNVFHQTRGEGGGEENDVKMLAAGVLVRLGEAIEKHQALLMGEMIGFT